MTRHRCPECGWVHESGQTQADRIVSWILVLAVGGLIVAGLVLR